MSKKHGGRPAVCPRCLDETPGTVSATVHHGPFARDLCPPCDEAMGRIPSPTRPMCDSLDHLTIRRAVGLIGLHVAALREHIQGMPHGPQFEHEFSRIAEELAALSALSKD